MKLSHKIIISFGLGVSLLALHGCSKETEQPTGPQVIHYTPVFPETEKSASTPECDSLVKSVNVKQAYDVCLKQAKEGDALAQYQLAKMHLEGTIGDKNKYLAQSLFTQAAERGVVLAQLELANLYYEDQHIDGNGAKAFHWYSIAAQQEDPYSLFMIGISQVNGLLEQPKNVALGATFLKRSADKGYYPAQYALASLYLDGYPVLEDKFTAIQYLRQAALGGSLDAQVKLAKVLVEFSIPQYDKAAFYWAEKAAESQNPHALFLLGNLYTDGIGTTVNQEKAIDIFNQLAEQNHVLAQCKLGQMYFYGKGVEKNISQAKKWFLRSARLGSQEAKNWIAILYRDGLYETENDENQDELNRWIQYSAANGEPEALFIIGMNSLYGQHNMPQNVDQGFELIIQAADKSFVPALRELGMIHERGLFGMNDSTKALDWYLKAAQKGDGYAQYRLANMYFAGEGTQRDYVESYAWAHLAALSGKEEARVLRDEVSYLLRGQDLLKARELSNTYFELHKSSHEQYAMPMNENL